MQTAAESDATEVDSDWLNYFEGYAEKASSEHVRDLWARVLNGEIRRPGSFSRATLRLLAELDQQMASWFEEEAAFRVEGKFILRPEKASGERISRLTFLEQVGLLQHTHPNSGMSRDFTPHRAQQIVAIVGDLALRIQTDREISVPVIPFTRIGKEITAILVPVDSMAILKRLGEAVYDKVNSMEICRVLSRVEDHVRLSNPIEVLKPAPTDSG